MKGQIMDNKAEAGWFLVKGTAHKGVRLVSEQLRVTIGVRITPETSKVGPLPPE